MHWITALATAEQDTPTKTAFYGWPVEASVFLAGEEGERTYVAYVATNPANAGYKEGLPDHEAVSAYFRTFDIDPDDGWRFHWLGQEQIRSLLTEMDTGMDEEVRGRAREMLIHAACANSTLNAWANNTPVETDRAKLMNALLTTWIQQGGGVTDELVEHCHSILNDPHIAVDGEEETGEEIDWKKIGRTLWTARWKLLGQFVCLLLVGLSCWWMYAQAVPFFPSLPIAGHLQVWVLTFAGPVICLATRGKFDVMTIFLRMGMIIIWELAQLGFGYHYGQMFLALHPDLEHRLREWAPYAPYAFAIGPLLLLCIASIFSSKAGLWRNPSHIRILPDAVVTFSSKSETRQANGPIWQSPNDGFFTYIGEVRYPITPIWHATCEEVTGE